MTICEIFYFSSKDVCDCDKEKILYLGLPLKFHIFYWQKLVLGSICEWPKEGEIMAFLHRVSWRRLLLPRYFVQTVPLGAPNMASSNITFPQLHTDLIHVLLLCLNLPSKHIFMPPMSCYSLLQIILWWCHYLLLWQTYHLSLLEFLFYLVSDKAVWLFFSKYVRLSSIPLPSHLLVYTVSISCLITSTDLDLFSLDTFPSLPNLRQQHWAS